MLRDKSLIPLSRQHQHALALCVRIERAAQAGEVELGPWQAEIQRTYDQEIAIHFAGEEKELFPAARNFPELRALVEELLDEHARLRDFFDRASARSMAGNDLLEFAKTLSTHIRKEERQLFEGLQRVMKPEDLSSLGRAFDKELQNASKSCVLPSAATRPRPRTR